jgi:hypothetical protein
MRTMDFDRRSHGRTARIGEKRVAIESTRSFTLVCNYL